jgi:hypothetical protein
MPSAVPTTNCPSSQPTSRPTGSPTSHPTSSVAVIVGFAKPNRYAATISSTIVVGVLMILFCSCYVYIHHERLKAQGKAVYVTVTGVGEVEEEKEDPEIAMKEIDGESRKTLYNLVDDDEEIGFKLFGKDAYDYASEMGDDNEYHADDEQATTIVQDPNPAPTWEAELGIYEDSYVEVDEGVVMEGDEFELTTGQEVQAEDMDAGDDSSVAIERTDGALTETRSFRPRTAPTTPSIDGSSRNLSARPYTARSSKRSLTAETQGSLQNQKFPNESLRGDTISGKSTARANEESALDAPVSLTTSPKAKSRKSRKEQLDDILNLTVNAIAKISFNNVTDLSVSPSRTSSRPQTATMSMRGTTTPMNTSRPATARTSNVGALSSRPSTARSPNVTTSSFGSPPASARIAPTDPGDDTITLGPSNQSRSTSARLRSDSAVADIRSARGPPRATDKLTLPSSAPARPLICLSSAMLVVQPGLWVLPGVQYIITASLANHGITIASRVTYTAKQVRELGLFNSAFSRQVGLSKRGPPEWINYTLTYNEEAEFIDFSNKGESWQEALDRRAVVTVQEVMELLDMPSHQAFYQFWKEQKSIRLCKAMEVTKMQVPFPSPTQVAESTKTIQLSDPPGSYKSRRVWESEDAWKDIHMIVEDDAPPDSPEPQSRRASQVAAGPGTSVRMSVLDLAVSTKTVTAPVAQPPKPPPKRWVYVVNGYIPSMREEYETDGAAVTALGLSWDSSRLSWKTFLNNVVGSRDPATAHYDSIRGCVYKDWASLGLSQCPDLRNNVVQASSSALCAMGERLAWGRGTSNGVSSGSGTGLGTTTGGAAVAGGTAVLAQDPLHTVLLESVGKPYNQHLALRWLANCIIEAAYDAEEIESEKRGIKYIPKESPTTNPNKNPMLWKRTMDWFDRCDSNEAVHIAQLILSKLSPQQQPTGCYSLDWLSFLNCLWVYFFNLWFQRRRRSVQPIAFMCFLRRSLRQRRILVRMVRIVILHLL